MIKCFVNVAEKMTEESSSSKDLIAKLENSTPFDGLETQYLQHHYYKENFNVSCSYS